MTSRERLSAHDLERASCHEAAHAVVAEHVGINAFPKVWPRSDAGPGERLWGGRCRLYPAPTDEQATMIALAGELAIVVLRDPETTADEAWDYLETGAVELSSSDCSAAGEYRLTDVKQGLALVRGSWPEIQDLAKELREAAGESTDATTSGGGNGGSR